MSDISTEKLLHQLRNLLHEGFQGSRQQWSYFSDLHAKGFLGTIAVLNQEAASKTSGPHNNTVAAHTWHLIFALGATREWIRGDRSSKEWEKSWSVQKVNEREWIDLQKRLREEFEKFNDLLEEIDLSDENVLGAVMGAVAHVAYHLGAVRQNIAEKED